MRDRILAVIDMGEKLRDVVPDAAGTDDGDAFAGLDMPSRTSR